MSAMRALVSIERAPASRAAMGFGGAAPGRSERPFDWEEEEYR